MSNALGAALRGITCEGFSFAKPAATPTATAAPLSKLVLWKPNPGPQTMAYFSEADEMFYGGAAGGGKTDLVLGLAGTAHHRSLIVRRQFPSMRGIIERSREIYNANDSSRDRDSYNESTHVWRLRDGRQIELGSMVHEKTKETYRGRPHDLKAWDELPEFTESQFRFTNAWNRSTRLIRGVPQRCRVVATGNPPTTPEGRWVVMYWAPWLDKRHKNPAKPGELRYFAMIDGADVELERYEVIEHKGERIYPRSRTFIPALLDDNPHLRETGYRSNLQGLPEPLRSQMLNGDFDAGESDAEWQLIPTLWIRAAIERGKAGRPRREDGAAVALTALGCDVARGGADATVVAKLYDRWFDALVVVPGAETYDGESTANIVIREWDGRSEIGIDVIGLGASPYDVLVKKGFDVQGINFGAGSAERDQSDTFGFRNIRAEAYWRVREALDPHGDDPISLPDDDELVVDLSSPRWKPSEQGGRSIITIESKADIKARIGRSTDRGDAVALALFASLHSAGFGFERW